MEDRQLTCIGCPMGCQLTAHWEGNDQWSITGNTCPKGKNYAQNELTAPSRMVTTSVSVVHGDHKRLSVKTCSDIPKDKIFDCICALKDVCVEAQVEIGDVILSDVAHTGVNVVSTRKVNRV